MANPGTTPSASPDPVGSFGSSLYDLIMGLTGQSTSQAQTAAAAADPFASQRGQYQTQLQNFMGGNNQPAQYQLATNQYGVDPSKFQTDPGYQFALSQGQEAIQRGANAALGTQRAGSIPIELAKYTEGFANQNYNNWIQQQLQQSQQQIGQQYGQNALGLQQQGLGQNQWGQMAQLLGGLSGATSGSPAAAGQLLGQGYANQSGQIGSGMGAISDILSMLGLGSGNSGISQTVSNLLRGLQGGTSIDTQGFQGIGDFGGILGDSGLNVGYTGDLGSLGSNLTNDIFPGASGSLDLGSIDGIDLSSLFSGMGG